MRNRDGISEYPGGLIRNLTFVIAAMVVVLVTILSAAPSRAQDAQVDTNDSVNDSFNTDVTIDAQSQECAAIVQQFNNAVAGDAVAADDAVAATAAAVDAPVNVVQSCLQADGDIVIGSGDNDGNDDGNVTEEVSDGQEDADDGAVQNDSTSAAQEQYSDTTSAGQEDSCAVALDPKVTVAENGEGSENLNVGSSQEGDYRIAYDLGDQTRELNIRITSAQTGSTLPINFTATEDGSRIVSLSATTYTITVTPENSNGDTNVGGYTVEVSRCGPSSDNSDNTMDNTYDSGKQLANTGGPTETFASPSAALIPVGVALLISGVIAAFWLRNASNRG